VRCGKSLPALSLVLIWPMLIRVEHGDPRPGETRPPWQVLAERYGLGPNLTAGAIAFDGGVDPSGKRLLHSIGDPDALLTFLARDAGRARISAAIEVSDVIPRVVTPEPDVSGSRSRPVGDYQPADGAGRCPRQLRVAGRVSW